MKDSFSPAILRGGSRPDLLRQECLADILAATARRRPAHPALIWGRRVVSYGELERLSRVLAGALCARGAGPGRVVGLFLPRGADLLVAQAGITRSGAAWLPFDAETPWERIQTCLQSAQAIGLVTSREWLPRLQSLNIALWAVEDLLAEPAVGLAEAYPAPQPGDPAYVIYTSGSTGTPKGIVIPQRGICHLLRAENEILGVNENDLVYQGFSAAFDMSFEEIWISYLVGATLWIAPPALVGDPEALAQTLKRERITVLHAVPTLVALIEDPLDGLRLINLGGEACPGALAQRLAGRPGRKVFNTYGPTETSVTATLAELKPGEPVTIGHPLPNYGLLVVDEQRRPLPAGEAGELCIFGPGLAAGYLGRADLTAQRFVPHPLAERPSEELMYLTGDLARIKPGGGPVICLGRADDQVKIRGFRVELGEITARLLAQPGVGTATVVLRNEAGLDQLVAFVVPAGPSTVEPTRLRAALAASLPAYMVPTHFEILKELPRLPSGKLDQNALRFCPLHPAAGAADGPPPGTLDEHEQALFDALGKLFPGAGWHPDADFFDDYGGHSLLAARLVSRLRSHERYATLSVQDVYRERRVDKIIQVMARIAHRKQRPVGVRPPAPGRRRLLCGLAQAVVLPVLLLLHIVDWLAPFFVYHYYTGDAEDSIPLAVGYSLATFAVLKLAGFAVAIAGKRLAGSFAPGQYPLWGFTFFRWWLADKFTGLADDSLLAGTPLMPVYLRALGARIGRNVLIEHVLLSVPGMLTVEDGASIGTFVNIENARVENGWLIIGPVHLQAEAVVGSYSVLENDTTIGVRGQLAGQSALVAGQRIPDDETWEGATARPVHRPREKLPPRPATAPGWQWAQTLLFAAVTMGVVILFFLPAFPAFMLIDWVDARSADIFESGMGPLPAFGLFFALALPASAVFIILTMLFAGAVRWLLPRQQPGVYPVYSFAGWRKKFISLVLDQSLEVLHGLYASVYAPAWLRILGVKVGRETEVSNAQGMIPELITLDDGAFIADGAMLGDEDQRGGWMILKETKIGKRSFVGNGAYVPNGALVPDDVLIGVQSLTPENDRLQGGQTWLGSPALLLPARENLAGDFPASLTFHPSVARRAARGGVEALRIVLPLALVIAAGYLIVVLVMPIAEAEGLGWKLALALALAGVAYAVGSFLIVLALKWLLIGRYRPAAWPMWTLPVWISEGVTNLYETLAERNFLDWLRGTPMLPWALRLFGAKIGRGVYLNTVDLTEFDCVTIGDECEFNTWSGPQTHLFEDRIMKIGRVEVGARTTVGARSTILYDTCVGANVHLGPLTLVAKGERLPPGSRWHGSPATHAE